MFDISFMEMLIVALAALVVIGPERLPKVARQAGQWVTRMRRYVEDVKSDFSRQIELAELQNLKTEVEDTARSFERGVQDTIHSTRSSFDTLASSVEPSADDVAGRDLAQERVLDEGDSLNVEPLPAPTDWDKVYEDRRLRQRLKDRRIERERERGFKRPRFRVER